MREVLKELPSDIALYHLPPASAHSASAPEPSTLPGVALQPLVDERRVRGEKPPARKTPTLRGVLGAPLLLYSSALVPALLVRIVSLVLVSVS